MNHIFLKITAMLLMAMTLLSMLTFYSTSAKKESPSLSARAASLYEPETKTFLYLKNADTRMSMASTTKIMTAIVAVESAALDTVIEVGEDTVGIEGSSLYLKAGEVLSLEELLYGLLLRSANDAAETIAKALCGSVDQFVNQMNQKAQQLGLTSTHFENPHGLDAEGHYTTARELALIGAYALGNPTIQKIVSTKKYTIGKGTDTPRLLLNHNKLLTLYDGAIGLKTGFTKKCGRTLVGGAVRNGLTLVTVTLDAPDDWNDHMALFDYGFSKLQKIKIVSAGEYSYTLPVLDGDADSLTVQNSDELAEIIGTNENSPKVTIRLPRFLIAPIAEGETVGECVVEYSDGRTKSIPIRATETVSKRKKRKFFSIFNK